MNLAHRLTRINTDRTLKTVSLRGILSIKPFHWLLQYAIFNNDLRYFMPSRQKQEAVCL